MPRCLRLKVSTAMTHPAPASAPALDFWFEFGSNYSYLSVMRIEHAAAQAGVALRWRPFLLGPIFRSFGWETSPLVLQKQKGEYVWRDMARQCSKYGRAWRRPSTFPRSAILPHRVALLSAQGAWVGAFCRAVMQLNFALDRDIDSAEVVSEVLQRLGLPAEDLIARAQSDDDKRRLRRQTEAAATLGHLRCADVLCRRRDVLGQRPARRGVRLLSRRRDWERGDMRGCERIQHARSSRQNTPTRRCKCSP
jgi:2-hydroxychromene-2-carboxylate isomerase